MRASALRCIPAEFSGARIRKKRRAGFPSMEANCTPSRLRPKAATSRSIPGTFPWGIATPSPIPVLPSPSRSIRIAVRRSEERAGTRRQTASESSRRTPSLVTARSPSTTAPGGTMSRILIEPLAP